jgi:hypothetical protein
MKNGYLLLGAEEKIKENNENLNNYFKNTNICKCLFKGYL